MGFFCENHRFLNRAQFFTVIFLLGCVHFWTLTGAHARTLDVYLDRDLPSLQNKSLRQMRVLEPKIVQLQKETQTFESQISRLNSENQKLEKDKGIFNFNKRKIKKNNEKMAGLQNQYQPKVKTLGVLSSKYRKARNLYAQAKKEIKIRQEEQKHLIEKNVELYKTDDLLVFYKNYKSILNRKTAQYQHHKKLLDRRNDPTDKIAIQLRKIVNSIQKEVNQSNYSFQIIVGEISKRQEDQNLEKQQLTQVNELLSQQKEFIKNQEEIWRKNKESEDLVKTSPLMGYKFGEYEENPKEEKIQEQRQFLIYLGACLALLLLIFLLVKKAFFLDK